MTPKETFSALVPWLLLAATLIFAAGPALVRRMLRHGGGLPKLPALLLLLAVSIYGGYFNGGLGIMLLAAFGFVGLTNLHEMNGLKSLMSAILSAVSVATYSAAGLIDWRSALVLGSLGVLNAALTLPLYVAAPSPWVLNACWYLVAGVLYLHSGIRTRRARVRTSRI